MQVFSADVLVPSYGRWVRVQSSISTASLRSAAAIERLALIVTTLDIALHPACMSSDTLLPEDKSMICRRRMDSALLCSMILAYPDGCIPSRVDGVEQSR